MAELTPYEKLLERHGIGGKLVFHCAIPGCIQPGSFGHGVALRKGIAGLWYCWLHNRAFLAAQAADAARARIAGGSGANGVPASPPVSAASSSAAATAAATAAAMPARARHGEGPRPRGGHAADPRQSHLL